MDVVSDKELHKVVKERMISFGQILRSERLRVGLTQRDLSHYAKVSCSKLSNIENGLCESIETYTIEKLCAVLEVHPGIFFVEKKPNAVSTED